MTTSLLCRTAVADFLDALPLTERGAWIAHQDADGTIHLERDAVTDHPEHVVTIDARGRCQVVTIAAASVTARAYPSPDACADAVLHHTKGPR